MKTLKRTWADISLDNLEYNYRSIRAHLPSGTRFLGVMKADAYGHGAVQVSRILQALGAEPFILLDKAGNHEVAEDWRGAASRRTCASRRGMITPSWPWPSAGWASACCRS